ncbi:hypothetical protein ACQY0O_002602 [Thecaphora frezii]
MSFQAAQEAPSILTSRFSRLNPFVSSRTDPEDLGEKVDFDSIAGGGHASRQTPLTKAQLRVSHAMRSFLVRQAVLTDQDAALDGQANTEAVCRLLDEPHINVPSAVTDRSYPLSEYFISSSHNTYLMAHQLYGTSSAVAYEKALLTGARCVEIDAWDDENNPDEPKVTHGYTLATHISFRAVCETIRSALDKETEAAANDPPARPAPILLSLENHCGAHGQMRLVQIMNEVWGDRLVSKDVREEGHAEQRRTGEQVVLEDLGSKIAVMVEYHFTDQTKQEQEEEDASSSSSDEERRQGRKEYVDRKKAVQNVTIIPELAALGVYAQSVKPADHSWLNGQLDPGPHDHMINMSETSVASLIPSSGAQIARHNALHLMRVFPKGTRISSRNLNPVPYWGVGAQVCALNWQTFDASMQLNEALFSGSNGYVLKPVALRAGGSGELAGARKRLTLHIAGATDLPIPNGREVDEIRPYVSCTLVHPHDLERKLPKRKTSPYKQHRMQIIHKGDQPISTDPIWDETLEWEYDDNELVFLRLLVKSDDKFARNPMFAVAAVRLCYAISEWRFIRLLDLKGRETHATLLVKFTFKDI